MRVQGELRRIEGMAPLNGSDLRRLVLATGTRQQRERFLASGELSSSHAIPGHGRFRVSAFVQRDSVAAVLRPVPAAIPTFDELGLPEVVRSSSGFRRGLVLVFGTDAPCTSRTPALLAPSNKPSRARPPTTLPRPTQITPPQ